MYSDSTSICMRHAGHLCAVVMAVGLFCGRSYAAGQPGNMVDICAGAAYYCSVSDNGKVYCWGDRPDSKPGSKFVSRMHKVVPVKGIEGKAVNVSCGHGHACVVTDIGKAMCWGDNLSGQLGTGGMVSSFSAKAVSGLGSGVVDIATGESHTCALDDDGTVQCWGRNLDGQLGDGSIRPGLTPRKVIGLPGRVSSITVGSNHSCAVMETGALYCWGKNEFGQLGNGTKKDSRSPVLVQGLEKGVKQVSPSDRHTCALVEDGRVKCWGSGEYGRLGHASDDDSLVPSDVGYVKDMEGKPVFFFIKGIEKLVTSTDRGLALMGDGQLVYWGYKETIVKGNMITVRWKYSPHYIEPRITDMVQVAAEGIGADNGACGITKQGLVKCWGSGMSGKLGQKKQAYQPTPREIEW